MRYDLVVATNHKTGTVWMDGVFKALAADLGARYINFRAEYEGLKGLLGSPFVLFCYDSDLGEHAHLLDRENVRILHLIRDPRDVVISAMHYHKASRVVSSLASLRRQTMAPRLKIAVVDNSVSWAEEQLLRTQLVLLHAHQSHPKVRRNAAPRFT